MGNDTVLKWNNLTISWIDLIKVKLKKNIISESPIENCFTYHAHPEWFYECDSCKKAKVLYNITKQEYSTDHFDTMTSWKEFTKAFLGYKYNDSFERVLEDYDKAEDKDKWIKSCIERNFVKDNPEKQEKAYSAFLAFSEKIYTVGNIIPVGYNPGPKRNNDHWDVKQKWIKETVFENKPDLQERRENAWIAFRGDLDWNGFKEKYFLICYEDDEVLQFPQKIDEWIEFFNTISNKIEARENAMKVYLNLE